VVRTSPRCTPTLRPRSLISGTVAVAVLSALVWHSRGPVAWERPIISLLRHAQLPMARPLVLLWQPLPFALATLGLAWAALETRRVRLAVSGTLGCVGATTVTEHVLKPLVDRHHLNFGSAVFPSGHVTAAAAWAMFALLVINPPARLRAAFVVVPVLVSWVTIAAGDHYPADTVAGLLVGGIVVYAVVSGADRLITRAAGLFTYRAGYVPSLEVRHGHRRGAVGYREPATRS
jgi:membrane-associated phospholipid phosphatase